MIEETALVTSRDGAYAEVETRRTSACGRCQAGSVCGTPLLQRFFGYRKVSIKALNPIDAGPGDEVVVGLQESALSRASFLFYLLPVLLLIGFAVVGQWLAEKTELAVTEPLSVIGGLLGLATGLLWARRNAVRFGRDRRYQAVILRRASPFKVDSGRSPVDS